MNALAETVSSKPAPPTDVFEIDMDAEEDEEDDLQFHNACLDEIDRYRRIDEWIPSYHNILSITALDCKRKLIAAGAMPFRPVEFLQYTRDGTSDNLRLTAFRELVDLGLIQNDLVFRWFLSTLGMDPSPYVRDQMLHLLHRALGAVAIGENSSPEVLAAAAAAAAAAAQQDNLIIEQESSTDARRDDLARKQTVEGALKALKAEMGGNEALKTGLWEVITSPVCTLRETGEILQICKLLFEPESSMIVVLKYPRYWQCTKIGKVRGSEPGAIFDIFSKIDTCVGNPGYDKNLLILKQATLRFSPTGRIRTTRKLPLPLRHTFPPEPPSLPKIKLQFQPPKLRADSSSSSLTSASSSNPNWPVVPPVPRRILKPPKRPSVVSMVGPAVTSSLDERMASTREEVEREKEKAVRPKLTLKLNLKGAGAARAKP